MDVCGYLGSGQARLDLGAGEPDATDSALDQFMAAFELDASPNSSSSAATSTRYGTIHKN